MIQHRRALHRIPELALELPKTAAYLRGVLGELPCRVFSPLGHAVCAFFDFGYDHAIALRSDMDALPICEATGLDFASGHPGQMHACGHDGHMAILLGVAEALARGERRPRANVLLIFQPGEETPGGALPLCRTGLLEQHAVREVYGLHLWPELEKHRVGSCPGPMMSRAAELDVRIRGRSCHLARWSRGLDALEAAADFLREAYALAARRRCVLRFGRMESGSVRNAVSDESLLQGSLRSFSEEDHAWLRRGLEDIARDLEGRSGCSVELRLAQGYPPVQNDPGLLARARQRLAIEPVEPVFLAEDFSEYQRRVPGVFFWLGTGGPALHSPDFVFDEAVLATGRDLLLTLLEAPEGPHSL